MKFTLIFFFSFHFSGLVILICAPVVSPLRRCLHVLTAGWQPSVTWPGGGVQSSLCSYLRGQTSPGRLKVRQCCEGRRLADSGPWSLQRTRPERASTGSRCRKRRGKSRWDTRRCAPSAPELTGPYGEWTRPGRVHDPRRSDEEDRVCVIVAQKAVVVTSDSLHNCHNNTAQTSKCSNIYIFLFVLSWNISVQSVENLIKEGKRGKLSHFETVEVAPWNSPNIALIIH